MEISDENLRTLSEYLQHTLNPDPNVRRPAEKFLEGVEVNQNYPILLLHFVNKPEIDITIRIAGAVAFKNYVKRNWKVEEGVDTDRIHPEDRTAIKQLIVTLMLSSPESIQKQLSDAISIIGKYDFPTKWPELISQMVEKFATGDFHIINGVLQTAHSLFKKYRYEFKSNELWTEIKLVLEKLALPLTELLQGTMELTVQHANNEQVLRVLYSSLVLVCKVFYSLNFQDLPEFFEDSMQIWMGSFHKLLIGEVKCLQTGENEDAGLIEQLKSQVCDNVSLYAQKYDEEFQNYSPQFVTDIWHVLVSTGLQPKYDLLVSNALQFLSTVADRAHYRKLFEDNTVLNNICENIIIPNMQFRTSDEELFEDNPEEYIRKDIEGSDIDTRRRAACDLVNTLSQNFEQRIMEIFGQYIQVMLAKYMENPKENWRSKDATLYLITSLVSRGQTQKHGVTQTSQLVSIPQFCKEHVLPELERADINELPVLKADAIKYVMTFRSILDKEMVVGTIPQLMKHLAAESQVTHTYAACAIEKILVMRTSDNHPIIKGEELMPLASNLLSSLFIVLSKQGSEENEYVMKAIMRTFSTLQEHVIPFLSTLLPKLTEKLQTVARNPSKPHFNHYLFESLSLSIKILCSKHPQTVSLFEEALFPIFQGILQQDIQEFMPYVFQLLSLMMEMTSPGAVGDPYMLLLPCLLVPALWERPANCSPLVRLLCAYVTQVAPKIVESDKLGGLLGIFQKLIASKVNDGEGFILLQCIMQHIPTESLAPFNKQIFFLLFQRLSSSKTTKYVIALIVFFCFYTVKYSANDLINIIDGIQQNMFGMVLEKIIITDLQKVSGNIERKLTACGIVKLLCDCPAMFTGIYQKFWVPLFDALLNFFEMPRDESTFPDDHFIEVDDTPNYTTANAKLNYANNSKSDPLQAVNEPRQFLAQNLSALCGTQPGIVPNMVRNLSPRNQSILQEYLSKFGVQLV